MANRRPQGGDGFGYGRNNNFRQNNWQTGPGPGMNQPLPGGSFLGSFPSYMHHDFSPNVGQYDRNPGQNWMGNQGHIRHSGNCNISGGRGRKPFKAKSSGQQNKKLLKMVAVSKSKAAKQRAATSNSLNQISYDHIDPQFLICHICKKKCKTGTSFEHHLREDSHFNKLHIRLKMYNSTVNKMRKAYQIRHMNAPQPMYYNFYCAMCDIHADDEMTHCKTIEHRKLTKFILPSCLVCNIKDMTSRHEYEEHRFTPEHMWMVQKRVQKMTKKKNKAENKVLVVSKKAREKADIRNRQKKLPKLQEQARKLEESRIISQSENTEMATWIQNENNVPPKQLRKLQKEKKKVSHDPEADVLVISTKAMEEIELRDGRNKHRMQESRKLKGTAGQGDNNQEITDYKEGDDLSNLTLKMFPSFSTARGVGQSFIEEVKCYSCKLCKKLLDSEETAALHPRTWKHHARFTRMLRYKSKNVRQKLKKKAQLKLIAEWSFQECAKSDEEKAQSGHDATADNIKKEPDAEMDEVCNQGKYLQAGNIKKEIDAEMDKDLNQSDDLEDWEQSDSDDPQQGVDLDNLKQSDDSDDSQHGVDIENLKQSDGSEVFQQGVDLDNLKQSDNSEDWNQDEDLEDLQHDDADGWKHIDDFDDWV